MLGFDNFYNDDVFLNLKMLLDFGDFEDDAGF